MGNMGAASTGPLSGVAGAGAALSASLARLSGKRPESNIWTQGVPFFWNLLNVPRSPDIIVASTSCREDRGP